MLARLEARQLLVEAGRVGRGADVDGHVVVAIGVRLAGATASGASSAWRRGRALEIKHDRVADLDPAPLDRLVARGALAQPRERLVDRRVVDRDLLAASVRLE